MNHKFVLFSIIAISVIGLSGVSVFGQSDVEIPPWVKGVANFWVEDKIDDAEFAEALEFLIDSNIIQLGNTVVVSEQEIGWKEKHDVLFEENKRQHADYTSQIQSIIKEKEDIVKELDKKYDDKEEEWTTEYDSLSADLKENHHIAEEVKSELKNKVRELEQEILQLKFDAGK